MERNVDSLRRLISKAARSLDSLLNESFTTHNLNISCEHWNVLTYLWKSEGLSQNQIAIITQKDKGSVTRLLETMEKRDLIVRIEDKLDKRKKLIYLTHKSKKLEEKVQRLEFEKSSFITEQLTEVQIVELKNSLTQIISNCKKSG